MTIYKAAVAVLKDSAKEIHVKDIHSEIVRRGLFQFGAKDPVSVLSGTLSKVVRKGGDKRLLSLGKGVYKYE